MDSYQGAPMYTDISATISRKLEIGIFAVFKKGQNECTQRKRFLKQ